MPIKIGDEYFKVTNAWNGKLLVASSCEASAHAMRYLSQFEKCEICPSDGHKLAKC